MLNLPNKQSTVWELFFEPCCCFSPAPGEDRPCTACSWGSGFADNWAVDAQVVGFLGAGVSFLCEHGLPCLTPGVCLVPHTYFLSITVKLQWPFGLSHGSEALQSHWSGGYIIRRHLQHSVLLGLSFRCLMSFLHFFHFVLWLCEFLSSLGVLFLYKCYSSTTALWRTSPPWWRHCCRCRACWAACHWCVAMDLEPFEKRGILHQRVISRRTTTYFGIWEEMFGFKKPRVDSVKLILVYSMKATKDRSQLS